MLRPRKNKGIQGREESEQRQDRQAVLAGQGDALALWLHPFAPFPVRHHDRSHCSVPLSPELTWASFSTQLCRQPWPSIPLDQWNWTLPLPSDSLSSPAGITSQYGEQRYRLQKGVQVIWLKCLSQNHSKTHNLGLNPLGGESLPRIP